MAERGFLCFVEIFDNGAGRGNKPVVIVANAESFERSCTEMLEQSLPRLVGIEVPAGAFGYNGAG